MLVLASAALWTGTASASGSGRAGAASPSLPSQRSQEDPTTTTSEPEPTTTTTVPSPLDGATFAECSQLVGYVANQGIEHPGLPVEDFLSPDALALWQAINAVPAGSPLTACGLAAVQGQVGGALSGLAQLERDNHSALVAAVEGIDQPSSPGVDADPAELAATLCVVFSLGFLAVRAA